MTVAVKQLALFHTGHYKADRYYTRCFSRSGNKVQTSWENKETCFWFPIKYLTLFLHRRAVLRRETGQAFWDFQNTQLAREGLPSRGDLLLAYSGTQKPGWLPLPPRKE